MRLDHSTWLLHLLVRLAAPKSTESVSSWCQNKLVFAEPDCRGPFSLSGREYLREPLDNWGREEITDQVTVMAPRTGKTRVLYGGVAWTIRHAPARCLYVKPKTKGAAGAEDDARTRFIPMLRASPELAELIPSGGQKRHEFKIPQQIIGGAIVDWTGSNSVGSLASNPCRLVVQDEVEKFNTTRKRDDEGNVMEADASALADERCKEYANPKRFKASTPTLPGGIIWEELTKKSDFRRYFVPCPHCTKHVLLAWSENFGILPKMGCEAWMTWDAAAKGENGIWDKVKVEASAHYACPHCAGKILDQHKPAMLEAGEWRPTRIGSPGYRGYHLPAMYALHAQCAAGKLAVRFLEACASLKGPRSFINNDLSEPYAAQDIGGKRVEAVSHVEVGTTWSKALVVDCQQVAPFFWYVARAYGNRESIGLDGGPLESWEDVEAVQKANGVPDAAVVVDSGWGSKDNAEVYRVCGQHGELIPDPSSGKLIHLGWLPAKGMPGSKVWRDPDTGLYVPWYYRPLDLFMGTSDAGRVKGDLFEFARDEFNTQLERLRKNKVAGYVWSIAPKLDTDEYHLHMRGQVQREKDGKVKWEKRHRHAKDHLRSCEIMQVAFGRANQLIEPEVTEVTVTEENETTTTDKP